MGHRVRNVSGVITLSLSLSLSLSPISVCDLLFLSFLSLSSRILDVSTAANASSGWNWFLRECSEVDFPTDIWFLHVAAIESKLRVHAGKHILSTTPEVKKVHGTSKDYDILKCI